MNELNELSKTKYAYLCRLSMEELLDLLAVAPIPAASPEKQAYVDALKEAIIEKENENPTGFFPGVNQQWEQFVTQYLPDLEETALESEHVNYTADAQTNQKPTEVPPKRVRFRWVRRLAIVAAAVAACVFGIILTAQAAGFDVFGAVARWSEDVFSFGLIPSESTVSENPSRAAETRGVEIQERKSFSSLQEMLDAYGVTGVHEPTWMPEGYAASRSRVEHTSDVSSVTFHTDYVNDDGRYIIIFVMSYEGEPAVLVQKTDELPKTLEEDGVTFYLLENSSGRTVAWYDDEYEYYVSGMVNKEILWKIAHSMCE